MFKELGEAGLGVAFRDGKKVKPGSGADEGRSWLF